MIDLKKFEVWFVTGSQHLYGDETLKQVAAHAEEVAKSLDGSATIPVKVVSKPVVTTPEEIRNLCIAANSDDTCVGLITWMHTFSPAKMWINGLKILHKPFMHLHTQFNRDIPWGEIDMDFMNLNQSAHGGREFGFIATRMGIERKIVVGHWQDEEVMDRIAVWTRVACAVHDMQKAKFARFADNMRQVAVTEGDKVEAEMKFGYSVNGYGLGDLNKYVKEVTDNEIDHLIEEYESSYQMSEPLAKNGAHRKSLWEAAKIEVGISTFLQDGDFQGFTDSFEVLHGLHQLPGIAVQRLMAQGYGFGAEGDWKTAALVRAMKVMSAGLPGGNSFMEDYTYHFHPGNMQVLGAHMLEICPSITKNKPSCEIHPLSIGGKADPVRLVFNGAPGPALNACIIELGNRFRLLVNKVEAIDPEKDLPKLPVARVLWKPKPDLKTAAATWILAGGAHHTCYSQSLSTEYLVDFAEMVGMECLIIDEKTEVGQFKKELRWNQGYYG